MLRKFRTEARQSRKAGGIRRLRIRILWRLEENCTAFGDKPAQGTLAISNRSPASAASYLVNSFAGGMAAWHTNFPRIHHSAVLYQLQNRRRRSSGLHLRQSPCGREVVRTATEETTKNWSRLVEVGRLKGKKAHIEIVDKEAGPWPHQH